MKHSQHLIPAVVVDLRRGGEDPNVVVTKASEGLDEFEAATNDHPAAFLLTRHQHKGLKHSRTVTRFAAPSLGRVITPDYPHSLFGIPIWIAA